MKMTIGQRIKNRRIELNLSVDEVAEKLNKNRATIYRYEKDDIKELPITVLEPLAKVLETTPADLMGWDNNNQEIQPVLLGSELNNIFAKLAEEYNKPKEYLISLFFSCDLNHLPASQRTLNEKNIRYVLTNLMNNSIEPATLAAHFDGEEYTESELDEIRQFAEFVKNKRVK